MKLKWLGHSSFEITLDNGKVFVTDPYDNTVGYPPLHVKADVVLSSTPGVDVYQWKRSRNVKWYAHILHAANDVTAYRMFGIDYYDAIMTSGDFQAKQVRQRKRQLCPPFRKPAPPRRQRITSSVFS